MINVSFFHFLLVFIKTSLGQDNHIKTTSSLSIEDGKTISTALTMTSVGKEIGQRSAFPVPFWNVVDITVFWSLSIKTLKNAWTLNFFFLLYFIILRTRDTAIREGSV